MLRFMIHKTVKFYTNEWANIRKRMEENRIEQNRSFYDLRFFAYNAAPWVAHAPV